MTDPRNVAHDKRVRHKGKHHGGNGSQIPSSTHRPGMKPHQQPLPGDHGPDPDEPVDKIESGEEL